MWRLRWLTVHAYSCKSLRLYHELKMGGQMWAPDPGLESLKQGCGGGAGQRTPGRECALSRGGHILDIAASLALAPKALGPVPGRPGTGPHGLVYAGRRHRDWPGDRDGGAKPFGAGAELGCRQLARRPTTRLEDYSELLLFSVPANGVDLGPAVRG